jgi:hypothetical protein
VSEPFQSPFSFLFLNRYCQNFVSCRTDSLLWVSGQLRGEEERVLNLTIFIWKDCDRATLRGEEKSFLFS